MTKHRRKLHLAWRGGALCGQRHPKPDITSNPSVYDCVSCYKAAKRKLKTTHNFGSTIGKEGLSDERGYLNDSVRR